ncbi:type III polyketide synthase [Streptomyces kasugaensis]|uniref:Type III polyketide synthase n=1 Tax=Streptomyces kasugaensis TaxID=1946 RepID=A0A4Q9I1S2_STRKA|nr:MULTISPECIES: 3-oxoacyl-[acyl-carrier-protein] synthase III C-terminal domain-containing protein [Streptomyces]MYU55494.1 type III polyketide synthase [Streptomyces sp. SID7805]TBO61658.1 type III polyketide synthase [Streptomyces kasugaensis]
MTHIAAVHGVLAPHRYAQREITDMVARTCLPVGADHRALYRMHRRVGVRARHMTLPLDRYAGLGDFGAANDTFITTAVDLGADAVGAALDTAGLSPRDVDLLMFTSVTGIAAPSVDARLVGRLGLRRDVKRLPVFGLGCAAGAAGLARLHDYLLGRPDDVAVLLSVELCTLTLQRADTAPANLIATGLFGDGAAAVVACGTRRAVAGGPTVVAGRSQLYPGTEDAMGWGISGSGFRVVLGAGIPELVRENLAADVDAFLADHGLRRADITAWVCHPGGPKVLDALAESLALPDGALDLSRRSLADVGNLSSASVLHVLRDTLAERRPPAGTPGLLLAMGPGFCSELVLLRW